MALMQYKYLVGDFETTVYKGQENTEVWASAVVEIGTEDCKIFHSIDETYEYLTGLRENIIIYYHNLKFDGSFWVSYLLKDLQYAQATEKTGTGTYDIAFLADKDMPNRSFKYSVSDMGQWYTITIKINNKLIEIRDSLKLLPFSVREIGKSFKTKHQKLDMEYTGFRYAGCEITDEEKKYIANDVFVVKEALEIMREQGHTKLTIGSCCLEEFRNGYTKDELKELFPKLTEIELDKEKYGAVNADDYIRKSYRGGWCYLVKGKENKRKKNGTTADVNSLYPSMMHSDSGNYYPVGLPQFWKGNYLPFTFDNDDKIYYFIRIKTQFKLKPGKLPCIQIKNNYNYKSNEWLETSDIYNKKTGKYYPYHRTFDGTIEPAVVELTLTKTDFKLIREHYDLYNCEILDGCYFNAEIGIFDKYIDKYKKIKMESKGAIRQLAKLFLNNLYGKMGASTNSSFKYAYLKPNGVVGFIEVVEFNKEPGYIPIGSAITSYARNFTIRAAQANYHGVDARGFVYADTDSIHCDLEADEIKGIQVHPTNFCCWKLESSWDEAIFTRQKTYIEHIVKENCEPCEPYYNVKCAGMPDHCKDLLVASLEGKWDDEEYEEYTQEEKDFVSVKRTYEDFTIGLIVPGKLIPKRILGGILLTETSYEMR